MESDEEVSFQDGFLKPIEGLSYSQIDNACEAAFANAMSLLEEADVLRDQKRCARAYFLAHVACEELGKLPILTSIAVRLRMKWTVDWKKIDRQLRSHEEKIKQVLFMDSLHGEDSLRKGEEAYEKDVAMMKMYTDTKNAALYSFSAGGRFLEPNRAISCEVFDGLRRLAYSRLRAFEAMYIRLLRDAGGVEALLTGPSSEKVDKALPQIMGDEGRAAFDEYKRTGDEAGLRSFFDKLISEDAPNEAEPRGGQEAPPSS